MVLAVRAAAGAEGEAGAGEVWATQAPVKSAASKATEVEFIRRF